MIYAAILAGGIGKRIERTNTPKQFIKIGGVPVIVLTLRTVLKVDAFSAVYIAVHPKWKDYLKDMLSSNFSEDELDRIRLVDGGKERLYSFINVMDDIISEYGLNEDDILICHDSVRPFVTEQMLLDCITETIAHDVALTAISSEDTMFISNENGFINGTLDRSTLFRGQTPSGFKISLLKKTCDSISEEEKCACTGTTQLMLSSGKDIKIVEGNTKNFKITTDNDLDVADRIMRTKKPDRSITLLDCTLRDGGIVINFDFGLERMQQIRKVLENAGVQVIECGYINEKAGSPKERTCFDNADSIAKNFLKGDKKSGVQYVAMIDHGTFELRNLSKRDPDGIDGIRYAFHMEHWHDALEQAQIILEKGYDLYTQPMVTLRYSNSEFRELIKTVNHKLPEAKAFYIVDSFGQMDALSLTKKMEIVDHMLSPTMKIGFHAHNNRQLAYSNALIFINYPAQHDIMLDSSIMGMGKGAGNLCTELITGSLIEQGCNYDTTGIYEMMSEYFSKVIVTSPWGYSLEYYFASAFGCTPSYIKIFKSDERVDIAILVELLKNMPEDKRAACDKVFAKEYLQSYFGERQT